MSYEMATGEPVKNALQHLPCERVIEVHIAGGRLSKGEQGPIYIDAHESRILPQTWDMLESMLPELPAVKAVCYECEGVDEVEVIDNLKK